MTLLNRIWVEFIQLLFEVNKRSEWTSGDVFQVKFAFSKYNRTGEQFAWKYELETVEEVREGSLDELPGLFADLIESVELSEDYRLSIRCLDC